MKRTFGNKFAFVLLVCFCAFASVIFSGCSRMSGELIEKSAALQIAFEHFDLEEEDCTVRKAELDEGKYEIEFVCGSREYDIEIDAYTGKVRERDVEYNDDRIETVPGDTTSLPDNGAGTQEKMISVERAKELAIEHFGLKAEDCTFIRANLDSDGREYELEFISAYREYDVEIDAYTGRITESDMDSILD